jgi:hypothetical protein
MSIDELVAKVSDLGLCDYYSFNLIFNDMNEEYRNAKTEKERIFIIDLFLKFSQNVVSLKILPNDKVNDFIDTVERNYCLFLISDSLDGDNIDPIKLKYLCDREINDGRMPENYDLLDKANAGIFLLKK